MTEPYEAPPCAATACTRPAAPVLCVPDERRLLDMLTDLRHLWATLDPAPSMQGREPGTGGGSGLKSQRTPANLDVLSVRDARTTAADDSRLLSVLGVLAGWADVITEGRGLERTWVTYRVRIPDTRRIGPGCVSCEHESCTFPIAYEAPHTVASARAILTERRNYAWAVQQDWAGAMYDEIRQVWSLLKAAVEGPAPRRRARCDCGGWITVRAMVGSCDGCGRTWQGLDLAKIGAAA
jgi:hypothetical protein